MPEANQIIIALNQVFQTKIFEMMFLFIITVTIMLLLKVVAEALVGYVQFILNQHISIGSPIEIYGKYGRIKELNIFTITVETDCGYIRVPTKLWRSSRFIALKDKVLYDRRKENIVKEIIKGD